MTLLARSAHAADAGRPAIASFSRHARAALTTLGVWDSVADRADSHPPITYPIALTVGAKSDAAKFAAYLSMPVADAVFVKYGFVPLH
jgi:hypothetical protein